jgi:hypothetical protein
MSEGNQPAPEGDVRTDKTDERSSRTRPVGEVFNQRVVAEMTDAGEFRVQVSGSVEYGSLGRKTSASLPVGENAPNMKAIQQGLERLLERNEERLAARLQREAARALNAAVIAGEESDDDDMEDGE